jgi:hypothetical protein
LRNPVWTAPDNLRDPSVFKTSDGYRLFYSRYTVGPWSNPANWAVAGVFTRDFVHFEHDRDLSPKGFRIHRAPPARTPVVRDEYA